MQNLDTWEKYVAGIERDEIPLGRAYRPTAEERLIREFVLQLKRGSLRPDYFSIKYGVDVLERFADGIGSLSSAGYVAQADRNAIALTRDGLLRVDVLLPRFFLPQHLGIRYT
jgi:oxygen-independent coproporphyrinogen-3 oxidase